MCVTEMLFSLLRAQLQGVAVEEKTVACIHTDTLEPLYQLSKAHDLAHIVGVALSKTGKLGKDEISVKFKQASYVAMCRYEQKKLELQRLCKTLETAGIPFIPLKGAVVGTFYPEPWMRTSCDIDVLIHEEDIDSAVAVLAQTLEYKQDMKTTHDISLFSPGNIHIELHYRLVEDNRAKLATTVLNDVWDSAKPRQDNSCWYELSDEMLYFYHIAHMAKHFENGGCGVRPFLDLWILDSIQTAQQEKREALLLQGGLLHFAENVRLLGAVWLGKEKHNALTQEMERFILDGGIYGNMEKKTVIEQQKRGGKVQYFLSKTVLPYEQMKETYPVLQKHRWLLPAMQVRRWFRILIHGIAPQTKKELAVSQKASRSEVENVGRFLKDIGL